MKNDYDVIIVGAGPAGSSSAKILADKGYKVAIIEKEKLPRHKHCGGCVSIRCSDALKRLNVNIEDIPNQKYQGFIINYKNIIAKSDMNEVMGWGIYREEFDYIITKSALNAGATIINSKVKGYNEIDDKIQVYTDDETFETKILFAADGINSTIRKNLGIVYDKDKLGICLEAEVKTTKEKIEEYENRVNLDLSYLNKGYVWAFPKKFGDTINVGIGCYLETSKKSEIDIKKILRQFVKDRGISDKIDNIHGALIPFGGTVDCFGKNNIILLGDAAGLVSPMSGEGIPYAIDSGILAAESAIEFLENQTHLVESYTKKISYLSDEINNYGISLQKRLFGNDFKRKLMVKMFALNYNLIDKVGKIFIHIISYKEGVKELSPLKLLPIMVKSIFHKL